MIGHYLLTLTEEQEDRVLTKVMRPWLVVLEPSAVGAQTQDSGDHP